jgi:hypothetical protein
MAIPEAAAKGSPHRKRELFGRIDLLKQVKNSQIFGQECLFLPSLTRHGTKPSAVRDGL